MRTNPPADHPRDATQIPAERADSSEPAARAAEATGAPEPSRDPIPPGEASGVYSAIWRSLVRRVASVGSPLTLSLPEKNRVMAACIPPLIIARRSSSLHSMVHCGVPTCPGTQVGGVETRSTVQVPPSTPAILKR